MKPTELPTFREWALFAHFQKSLIRIWRRPALALATVALLFSTSLSAQVVINEIQPGGTIELKNIGTTMANVSDYWLCDFPAYQQISNSNVICGDMNMLMPGEILAIDDFNVVDAADGEMGLYTTNSFGSSAAMIDYVEWGSTGHQRSSVAVAAGIWTTGAFVPAFGANESLEYDGDGNDPSDWAAQATPTICNENGGCAAEGGTISTNDPTTICVDGNPDPINVTVMGSSGTNGGWIITDDADNILALPAGPPFDLDGAGDGVCLIWYIRYENGLTGLAVDNNLSDLMGCFDLSNSIAVTRQSPDGGTVSLTNGNTTYANCAGNIVFDMAHVTTATALSYWYIITDQDDNILAWQNSANGNTLDLSAAPAGECHVWGWSYRGLDDPIVGEHISTLADDDCEAISDNWVTVYREIPDGGMVSLTNGDTTYANCAGNIVFDMQHTTTAPNLSYWYIITDQDDNILAWVNSANGNTLDLSAAPAGECHVWGWNYRGLDDPIVGEHISTLADDDCEDISDNWVTVYRETPDGGMVSLTNGDTTYANCAGNIVFDMQHTTTAPNLSYWYIITDQDDNILAWVNSANGNTLDLSAAPAGECHVWGWNYRGLDDPIVGEHISTLADDDCEDISDNWVTVYREIPDGGMVSLVGGGTSYTGFAGNIVFDVEHTTTAPNLSYWYIITDQDDNILAWVNSANGNTLDLSGAPAGECHVWGWNYRGLDDPIVGENISTLADDDCEAISDNWITVIRESCDVETGDITLADGSTSTSICVDGNGDPLDVVTSGGTPNVETGWVITDDLGNILALPMAPPFDLDGAGVGVCLIWYIRYEAGLTGLEVGNNASELNGCFDLSNPIEVIREAADGGMVSLLDGSTSYAGCAGDIVFDVTHENDSPNLSYWYIITDQDDNIITWVNSADGNTIDASGAPAGECHIWGWSYRGLDDPIPGEHISTLADDDCEAISDNWITLYREVPDGGMVSLLNGSTSYAGCAGDIMFDVQHTTTAPNLSYWYIITDQDDNIITWVNSADGNTIDASGAPAGECHIWGWNYRGLDDPIPGENISTLADDFCEAISDNWITLYREVPDGGMVSLLDGSTSYAGCAGDIMFDVQHTTTAPNLSYWYIITDQDDNIITWVNSADGNTIDASGAPAGECHIWGWNYRGLDDPIPGEHISTLADDFCEAISDNWITLYREVPDGGMVSLLDGSTSYAGCAGDIMFDVQHTTTAPNLSYWYIITDQDDNIITWVNSADGNTIDASGAPAGECHIWGWNYRGLDDPIPGEHISTLADDFCEAISDNWITLYREVPDGGMVSLLDGSTSYAGCAGDIMFDVQHTTTAPNLSYWYIITDQDDNIITWVNSADGNTIDASGAPAGECHIWGWNYRGLDDPIPGEHISTLADDFCEAISDNWITLYREVPDGGTLDSDMGTDITICVDGTEDPITLSHETTAPNLSYWYIITDDNDNILDWLNSANGNVVDLDGAGVGVCRIWGWNYRGLDDPIIGENISTLNDDFCESISDEFITVTRVEGADCLTAVTDDFADELSVTYGPVPFSSTVNLTIESELRGEAELRIFNLQGQLVNTVQFEMTNGTNSQVLDLADLPSGQLVATLFIGGELASIDKLIKE